MLSQVVIYASCFERDGCESKTRAKENEKGRKKFLTKSKARDILSKLTASAVSAVSCKLNNAKTIFNTLDNYGLFKRKRKNSQRKFLSNRC